MQAEGAIGLRQGRGGKGAEQVGGIHGGLFGCLSRGRYGLFGSRVLAGFCFWGFCYCRICCLDLNGRFIWLMRLL